MRRLAKIIGLLIAASAIIGLAAWRWSRGPESPEFGLTEKRIEVTVKPSLAVGNGFAAMVAPDGSLWVWGTGEVEFGVVPGSKPQRLGQESDWRSVTAGYYGLLALKNDGSLWAIGRNGPLLGLSVKAHEVMSLTMVGTSNDWKEVKAGKMHCMALKEDGSLWAWGENIHGVVGVGKTTLEQSPTRIGLETNWVAISPGEWTSYALKSDGSIWHWGEDAFGRIITVPEKDSEEANWTTIAAGDFYRVGRKADDSYWIKGHENGVLAVKTHWTRIDSATNWTEVYCGENVVIAKTDQRAWVTLGRLDEIYGKTKLPKHFEPLAIWTQFGTILILMPDGRLWSLGERVGEEPRLTIVKRLENLFRAIIGAARSAPSDVVDKTPYLIWEHVEVSK